MLKVLYSDRTLNNPTIKSDRTPNSLTSQEAIAPSTTLKRSHNDRFDTHSNLC
ncbi:hypothetical protein [Planktothrix agardhii]|uniref:hypothetical protein n=1 Tax=Planktothrix agardhii TaxID=1160 RepID=UPI0012DF4AE2|nr:hypothetical protein [Planktothrix agardhii]